MKIAIQGHSTRGKEVIQILESLGGINRMNHSGSYTNYFYYISNDDNTIGWTGIRTGYLNAYTLEKFEKEFPFKIGDRVISVLSNFIGTITKLKENGYYYIKYDNGILGCTIGKNLKLYKEMKEERNITLTLEKAKEWYKKGGELKEIALQAFSEKELNPLPKSWEEFAENNARMGYYISADGKPLMCASSGKLSSPHVCPSKKSAEAHLAMIQLEQLRNCWRQGWKPEYHSTNYAIKRSNNEIHVIQAYSVSAFLSFPTKEMAEDFLACFRDLIEKAGDLI